MVDSYSWFVTVVIFLSSNVLSSYAIDEEEVVSAQERSLNHKLSGYSEQELATFLNEIASKRNWKNELDSEQPPETGLWKKEKRQQPETDLWKKDNEIQPEAVLWKRQPEAVLWKRQPEAVLWKRQPEAVLWKRQPEAVLWKKEYLKNIKSGFQNENANEKNSGADFWTKSITEEQPEAVLWKRINQMKTGTTKKKEEENNIQPEKSAWEKNLVSFLNAEEQFFKDEKSSMLDKSEKKDQKGLWG